MPTRFPIVPAAFFGMPLGLIALGIAWRGAAVLWSLPDFIADGLIGFGSFVWCVLTLLYAAKWLLFRDAGIREFADSVQGCFIGLCGVVASLASIGLRPLWPDLAFLLFGFGGLWTLLFAVHRTGTLWMGGRRKDDNTAVLFLPTVEGAFVNASAAVTFGYREFGQLLFGAGFFAWLAIESVVLHRLYTSPPLAPALRPTLGIQLAPPAVAAVAYLNVGSGVPDLLVHALVGYALLQALILVRLIQWLRAAGSTPAWWAFTFGAAALPTAAIRLASSGTHGIFSVLAPWLFLAGNIVVALALTNSLYLLFAGKLILSPSTSITGSSGAGRVL